MSGHRAQNGRRLCLAMVFLTMAMAPMCAPLRAQELGLKRALPGNEIFACSPTDSSAAPGPEERTQAGRLGSNADQALILGDRERARDLLARATELDPSSASLAYRYARVLEDLGARNAAIAEYCRVILLGPEASRFEDAASRMQSLLDEEWAQIPDEAIQAFETGLSGADEGRLEAAMRSFGLAWQRAPEWADAVFNRGIVEARLGRVDEAVADLQRYLNLRPEAPDAILVSRRIGELRSLETLPRPAAAFTLGLLFPGMGQFYSGRAFSGITVLTLAAGAAATGFLVEEVTVFCVGSTGSGGECPEERVIGEEVDTPYLTYGLAAAGAVAVIGAIEAYFRARGRRSREAGTLVAMKIGRARLSGPAVSANGRRLQVDLARISF